MSELNDEKVIQYLRANPATLEAFVTGPYVSKDTFQRWAQRRSARLKRVDSRRGLEGAWTSADLSSRRRVILDNTNGQTRLLFELAQCCGQMIGTDQLELVLLNDDGAFVVSKDGAGLSLKKRKKGGRSPIFTQKLMSPIEDTIGEINFYTPLNEREKQEINIICAWGAGVVHFAQLSYHLEESNGDFEGFNRQRKLQTFLLDVAKSFFQDIVSMDTIIIKIMNFAQKLVNADRASLFLVDAKRKEIYARIFDVGIGEEEHVRIDKEGQKEIRFPMSKGVAGRVAETGEGMNIDNAYENKYFNPDVDQRTGYSTKTILCMPIRVRHSIIGVVQMVNKQDGVFTQSDQDAFEVFSVYCGLALHFAKLYDRIRRSEQKYRVALEVLAYHSVCHRDEVSKLTKFELKDRVPELETFDFNGMRLSELEKPLYAVYMFQNLFSGHFRMDREDLTRFVLTVRKNYRRVPYHNWAHGWSVAHAMFVLLTYKRDIFSVHEGLALYLSCLCHDLDHRGKNNAYMKSMSTPLANIYTTSVMEHHHFNQTVTILQQEGHNILKAMSIDDYKEALSLIKHCILATDLALFFTNKAELIKIIDAGDFDIQVPRHRRLTQAILMTGCDLIASAKPWQIQTETVKVIFEEFYEQGDAERLNGRDPIAMMDRNKAHELPQMQVGFMRGICMPCYELIAKIIPEAASLRDRCQYNAEKWEELAAEQKRLSEAKEKESSTAL